MRTLSPYSSGAAEHLVKTIHFILFYTLQCGVWEPVVTHQTSWLEAQVYVEQSCDLEDRLPQKEQLLLKLLTKMLQLLQKLS